MTADTCSPKLASDPKSYESVSALVSPRKPTTKEAPSLKLTSVAISYREAPTLKLGSAVQLEIRAQNYLALANKAFPHLVGQTAQVTWEGPWLMPNMMVATKGSFQLHLKVFRTLFPEKPLINSVIHIDLGDNQNSYERRVDFGFGHLVATFQSNSNLAGPLKAPSKAKAIFLKFLRLFLRRRPPRNSAEVEAEQPAVISAL